MSQAIKVTRSEHANGTFDVIYRNAAVDAQMTENEQHAWLHLLTAVIAGVNTLLVTNTYRDAADVTKASTFIELLNPTFGGVLGQTDKPAPTMGAIAAGIAQINEDSKGFFSALLESLHISSSIIVKEDTTQLRGLVTVAYRLTTGEIAKVRLSGVLEEAVGLALRAPYNAAVEAGTLEVIPAEPKPAAKTEKVEKVEEAPKAAKPKAERPPTAMEASMLAAGIERPAAAPKQRKIDELPAAPRPEQFLRLSREDKEEIAAMVTRNLIAAMSNGIRVERPRPTPNRPVRPQGQPAQARTPRAPRQATTN